MRSTRRVPASLSLVSALVVLPTAADAQPLGTFRWQLQPFCNVAVVNVTQQGAIYQVDGFDDQCGAPQRAPLVGMATANPDGTIGFGLNIVTTPSGRGVQLDARISLPGLSGARTDSFGNKGTFAFGASTGGPARELTGFGALAVNPAQVQLRVVEACVTGQVIQTINQDGSVTCGPGFKTAPNGGLDASSPGGLVSAVSLLSGGLPAVEGPGKRFL